MPRDYPVPTKVLFSASGTGSYYAWQVGGKGFFVVIQVVLMIWGEASLILKPAVVPHFAVFFNSGSDALVGIQGHQFG